MKKSLMQWIAGYAGFLLKEGYITCCSCSTREWQALIEMERDDSQY